MNLLYIIPVVFDTRRVTSSLFHRASILLVGEDNYCVHLYLSLSSLSFSLSPSLSFSLSSLSPFLSFSLFSLFLSLSLSLFYSLSVCISTLPPLSLSLFLSLFCTNTFNIFKPKITFKLELNDGSISKKINHPPNQSDPDIQIHYAKTTCFEINLNFLRADRRGRYRDQIVRSRHVQGRMSNLDPSKYQQSDAAY